MALEHFSAKPPQRWSVLCLQRAVIPIMGVPSTSWSGHPDHSLLVDRRTAVTGIWAVRPLADHRLTLRQLLRGPGGEILQRDPLRQQVPFTDSCFYRVLTNKTEITCALVF